VSGQLTLALDDATPVAVHCFTCPHVERGTEPVVLHAAMERHYAAKHAALIARIVGAS